MKLFQMYHQHVPEHRLAILAVQAAELVANVQRLSWHVQEVVPHLHWQVTLASAQKIEYTVRYVPDGVDPHFLVNGQRVLVGVLTRTMLAKKITPPAQGGS
jgi:hypothetical protein